MSTTAHSLSLHKADKAPSAMGPAVAKCDTARPPSVEVFPSDSIAAPPMESADLGQTSLLQLLLEADPHPHGTDPLRHPVTGKHQVPLHLVQADYHLSPPIKPMGYIPHEVIQEMVEFEAHRLFPVFTFFPRLSAKEVVVAAVRCVAFDQTLVDKGKEALSLGMEALVWFMRNKGSMKDRAFHREDIYSIFADPRSTAFAHRSGDLGPWDNVALTIFRQSSPYFGTPWIGVTMIVYEGDGDDLRIWVQKRAQNCSYPNMLDTTAGGAVESGRTAWQGMIIESTEEAGISGDMVRKYGSFEGGLNFYLDANTVPKPLIHLCFDLKRPDPSSTEYAATHPKVTDNEVQSFELLTVSQVLEALQKRQFQPSAIPDLLFFLIRKGFITRESEPAYDEILERFQRPWDVAFPHRLLEF